MISPLLFLVIVVAALVITMGVDYRNKVRAEVRHDSPDLHPRRKRHS